MKNVTMKSLVAVLTLFMFSCDKDDDVEPGQVQGYVLDSPSKVEKAVMKVIKVG